MKHDDKRKSTFESKPQDPMLASRARNRTVMLTPEVTGHVRALLQDTDEIKPDTRKRVDTGGFMSAHSLDIAEERKHNPTLLHTPNSGTGFPSGFHENANSRERSDTQFSSYQETREHKFTPSDKNGTSSFGSINPDLQMKGGTGTTEFRRASLQQRNHDAGEKGGTVTSMKAGMPELQRPIKPEVQMIPSSSRAQSTFNEERGLLVQETFKRHDSTARIIGFLVSFDQIEGGEVFELRVGRWLVSSNPMSQKDTIIVEDDSISALHAVVKVLQKGEVQILDQLSENGTGVMKHGKSSEDDASHGVITISHGDVVRFGKRYFVYCAVPRIQIAD